MRAYDDSEPALPEVPLVGGDVTEGLVRVGDTIRRPEISSSAAVARLLRHLEDVGFDGSPRHLGIDRRGRHVLSFVEGEVADRPWPAWVADEGRLVSLARLVRRYDDASSQAGLPEWGEALRPVEVAGAPTSIAGSGSFLAHLDITPENVVFRGGVASALIDFDLTRPATRAEELANLLLWWGPWMPPADRDPAFAHVDVFARTRLALDEYGLDDVARDALVDVARNAARRSWWSMQHRAETLGGGWARMWADGVGDRIARRADWLDSEAEALRRAVVRHPQK